MGLGITLGLLAWALHGVNARDLVESVRRANRGLILATVALATLTFPIRTLRWQLILRDLGGGAYPLRPLWHATAIGFMANNLLPVRAGEFARAYVASRQLPVRFSTALASVGVERVFDGLMLVSLMTVAIGSSAFPHQAALGPVVAAGEDVRLDHKFHIQPVEELFDLVLGINPDMRREIVAHNIRHPVGQDGQIARSVVFPGEKEAMCFKGI